MSALYHQCRYTSSNGEPYILKKRMRFITKGRIKIIFSVVLIQTCLNLSIPVLSMAAEKMKVAIADLQPIGVNENLAKTTSELLRTELFKTGFFGIMERSQMKELMDEHAFQLSGATSESDIVKLGQMLAVQYFLIGSMNRLGGIYVINIRLVDIELGKLKAAETIEVKGEENVMEAVKQISKKITGLTPIRGRVIKVKGKEILVSLGNQDRVKEGVILRVQRFGEALKEPVTGRILGREVIEVATLRIDKVISEEISTTTLLDEYGQIEVGDYAIIWSGGSPPMEPKKRQKKSAPVPMTEPQDKEKQPKRNVPMLGF